MAIVSVREIWNGRMAQRDMGNVREYRRTFQIETNNMNDGPFVVGNNNISGLPGIFTPYVDTLGNTDPGAILQVYRPRQTADPFTWEIECEYSSSLTRYESPVNRQVSGRTGKAENAAQGSEQQNPLLQPPVIHITNARYQRELDITQATPFPFNTFPSGTLIRNSVGDAHDPPPIADYSREVITYERNEASFPLNALSKYQDALNADFFWGNVPYTAKMNVGCQTGFQQGFLFWRVTYTIEMRYDVGVGNAAGLTIGWLSQLLDRGRHQIIGGQKVAIIDANGMVVQGEVPLDGAGHALPQGQAPVFSDPFSKYQIANYSPLQLIQPR
jgi:hypothetical protein